MQSLCFRGFIKICISMKFSTKLRRRWWQSFATLSDFNKSPLFITLRWQIIKFRLVDKTILGIRPSIEMHQVFRWNGKIEIFLFKHWICSDRNCSSVCHKYVCSKTAFPMERLKDCVLLTVAWNFDSAFAFKLRRISMAIDGSKFDWLRIPMHVNVLKTSVLIN